MYVAVTVSLSTITFVLVNNNNFLHANPNPLLADVNLRLPLMTAIFLQLTCHNFVHWVIGMRRYSILSLKAIN